MISAFVFVVLTQKLQAHSTFVYDVEQKYSSLDGADITTIESVATFIVQTPKDRDSVPVVRRVRLKKVVFNGQTLATGSETDVTEFSEKRSSSGRVTERSFNQYFPVLNARQLRPLDVLFPDRSLEVGESWDYRIDADGETGLSAASWTWQLTRLDDTSASIETHYSEKDVSEKIEAKGTTTIDLKDGWVRSLDFNLSNTTVPGDTEQVPCQLRVVWKRR